MSQLRTIIPHKPIGVEVEGAEVGKLGSETTQLPGTLFQVSGSDGAYVATPNNVRGAKSFIMYEEEHFGKTCRDAIPVGENAQFFQVVPGMRCTPIVKSGVAVAIGDLLIPVEGGLVDKPADAVAQVKDGTSGAVTTEGVPSEELTARQLFRAEEACLSGDTGDNRRILVRAL